MVQAIESPAWERANSRLKTRLADALMSGNEERIGSAVGRILAIEASGATSG